MALIALFGVLAAVNQRKLYWKIGAWKYRNPEAHEPSDTAYGMSRVGYVVAGLILAITCIVFGQMVADQPYSQQEVREGVDEAASSLREDASEYSFGPMKSEVEAALENSGGWVRCASATPAIPSAAPRTR